ncbi:MAG: hypothetical protein Q8Q32_02210 [bacterium]|nr:hypothetical protein [bacterium]
MSEAPKRSFKYFVVFLVLGSAFSIMSSYFLAQFNAFPGGTSFIALLAIVSLFSFFLLFQALLVRNFQFFLWVSLVEGAALFTYFYESLSPMLVFAGMVFVWSFLSAYHYGKRLLKQRINFSFLRFAQVVSAPVLRAFGLFLAILYVGLYSQFGLSQEGFNFILNISEPFVEPFVPGFSNEMNTNDFYFVFAKNQVENKFEDTAQFQSLSPAQREEAINTVARELRNKVGELTSTTVEPDDSVGTYFYKVAVNYLPKIESSPLGIATALALALAIYSAIALAALFIRLILIVPVSWVFYQALYGLGVVSLRKEMIEKDTIVLS